MGFSTQVQRPSPPTEPPNQPSLLTHKPFSVLSPPTQLSKHGMAAGTVCLVPTNAVSLANRHIQNETVPARFAG